MSDGVGFAIKDDSLIVPGRQTDFGCGDSGDVMF
jgi:hypothetical protein